MATDPKTKESTYAEDICLDQENLIDLYNLGKERLYKNGYLVIPDLSGIYGFHRIYKLCRASVIDSEINYPDTFKVWRELATNQERSELSSILNEWPSYGENWAKIYEFWKPLNKPNKARNSPLYNLTEQFVKEAEILAKRNSGQPEVLYIAPDPLIADSESVSKQKELAPISWIPKEEWFPENVKAISIHDIFTIFPKAEADLLALIVGRACVGRSNLLPPGYTDPIVHSARMAAFILGEDPGLGKTTLMKALFGALETVGYQVETFESMGSKFNLGPVVASNIVYKDDITDDEFKKLTKSGSTKSLISSADYMKVQDKGVDAYNVFPLATMFVNTNSYNPRIAYNVDPGFADRVKLLSTVREAELSDLDVPELSKGSPDYRPFIHLGWLADKLGVSQRVIMLWVARLCTDKFLALTKDRTALEIAVDRLTLNLREPMSKDSTSQLISAMVIMGSLNGIGALQPYEKHRFKRLSVTAIDWNTVINGFFQALRLALRNPSRIEALKKDFLDSHNDNFHPFIGLTIVDFHSVKNWETVLAAERADLSKNDPLQYLTDACSHIRMKNGLEFSKDRVWVNKAFQKIEYYLPQQMSKLQHYLDITETTTHDWLPDQYD